MPRYLIVPFVPIARMLRREVNWSIRTMRTPYWGRNVPRSFAAVQPVSPTLSLVLSLHVSAVCHRLLQLFVVKINRDGPPVQPQKPAILLRGGQRRRDAQDGQPVTSVTELKRRRVRRSADCSYRAELSVRTGLVPSVLFLAAAARDIRPLATDVVGDIDDSKSRQSNRRRRHRHKRLVRQNWTRLISHRTSADVCDGCARWRQYADKPINPEMNSISD